MKPTIQAEHFAKASPYAQQFVDFINKAVTPFHAVREMSKQLIAAGYVHVPEGQSLPEATPGLRAFYTRNDSSLVVFRLGGSFKNGNGMKIVGTHTDSPCFSVKPKSKRTKGPFQSVAVQPYGGGLWHTWFDRELTVAGRLILSKDSQGKELESKLVHVKRPLLSLPSLCIHLRNQSERDAFAPNKESQMVPIIGTLVADQLLGEKNAKTESSPSSTPPDHHQGSLLIKALSDEAGCAPSDIVDFDLDIIDTQPSTIGGFYNEFIHSPRIDNLLSCFCALKGLLEVPDEAYEKDTMSTVIAMFDNEEVGSESAHGAGGTMTNEMVDYLSNNDPRARSHVIANSFLLSIDCSHAIHPNYMDKHEEAHRPVLHEGPVVKYNVNTKYATTGATSAQLRAIANLAGVPLQSFVVRNDSPCGSTIGPIVSTLSGIKAIDIGSPMLSMHSVRELCGTVDILWMTNLISAFFHSYEEVTLKPTTYAAEGE